MKFSMLMIFLAAAILPLSARADKGGNGGDPLRDRFLLAKSFAEQVFEDSACGAYFGAGSCGKVAQKLKNNNIKWYEDPTHPLLCKVEGHVQPQPVIACTTPDLNAPIYVDIIRARQRPPTFLEAIYLMGHEGGHVLGTSLTLVTDEILLRMLNDTRTPSGLTLYQEILQANGSLVAQGAGVLCQIVSEDRTETFSGLHNLYKNGELIHSYKPTWNTEGGWENKLREAQTACLQLQSNSECRCKLSN